MNDNTQTTLLGGIGFLIVLALAVGLYVFYCYCLKKICEKTGRDPGVLIWIPILQLVPLLEVAGMAVWMIVLFFVPLVNAVVGVVMWFKICQARGKSGWLVILLFIPIVNLVFLPYLAFSD